MDDFGYEHYPKTIFCDIDGTIFKHFDCMSHIISKEPVILPGVVEKFDEWNAKGYTIIITTGRPECTRKQVGRHLESHGLYWNQLIMGLPRGTRIVINDSKPRSPEYETAASYQIGRNEGLENVEI